MPRAALASEPLLPTMLKGVHGRPGVEYEKLGRVDEGVLVWRGPGLLRLGTSLRVELPMLCTEHVCTAHVCTARVFPRRWSGRDTSKG